MSNEKLEGDSASTGKMVSYGFTAFIDSIVMASFGFTVFYYYEVEVGLSISLVGIAFVIFAIWNMINDPLVGYLTDKPRGWAKKWGVRRPWIFIGGFVTIIFFFLIFTPPAIDARKDPMPVFLYLILITCLFDTFYSLYTAHYKGGFVNQFRTNSERGKASGIMRLIGESGALISVAILIPTIIIFGDPSSFIRYGIALAIVMVIGMIIVIPGTKEDEEAIARYMAGYEEREKLSFWKVLKAALTSKNYMLQIFAYTMFMITANLFMANMFYFVKDVLNLPASAAMPVFLTYIIVLYVTVPIWVKVAKRIGPIKVGKFSLVLIGIGLLFNMITNSIIMLVIVFGIIGIFWAGYLAMYMAIQSDAYDEVTLECGCHQEATLLGISNFFARVAYLVIAVLIAVVHIATGYNPDPNATQTPTAVLGIRLLFSVIPAIFAFLGGIALILWYDLEGQKLMEMKTKLKECGL